MWSSWRDSGVAGRWPTALARISSAVLTQGLSPVTNVNVQQVGPGVSSVGEGEGESERTATTAPEARAPLAAAAKPYPAVDRAGCPLAQLRSWKRSSYFRKATLDVESVGPGLSMGVNVNALVANRGGGPRPQCSLRRRGDACAHHAATQGRRSGVDRYDAVAERIGQSLQSVGYEDGARK